MDGGRGRENGDGRTSPMSGSAKGHEEERGILRLESLMVIVQKPDIIYSQFGL